jgi:quercetin dioxygenase-like cupin family protein
MRRTIIMLAFTLTMGIVMGMLGNQLLSIAQEPVKRTVLSRADLAEIQGKEAVLVLAEIAPGAAAGKHRHSGEEFAYVLEGSIRDEAEGKAPTTLKSGDVFHRPPRQVHDLKNLSTAAPAKVLVFFVADKGQPITIPVQ